MNKLVKSILISIFTIIITSLTFMSCNNNSEIDDVGFNEFSPMVIYNEIDKTINNDFAYYNIYNTNILRNKIYFNSVYRMENRFNVKDLQDLLLYISLRHDIDPINHDSRPISELIRSAVNITINERYLICMYYLNLLGIPAVIYQKDDGNYLLLINGFYYSLIDFNIDSSVIKRLTLLKPEFPVPGGRYIPIDNLIGDMRIEVCNQ